MGMIFKKDYNLNLDVLNKCIKDGKILNSRLGLMLKCLARSINSDCIFSERLDEHDDFFIPKNETEQILWENLRTSAKIQIRNIETNRQNGKKGGRPPKEEEKNEKVVQQKIEPVSGINFSKRESFVYATPEELLGALKRDIVPNLGAYLYIGEEPSDEQLINYLQTRISTNWEKKGGGIIRNVGSDLACWLKNPISTKQMAKKDEGEEEQIQNVMIEVD